MFLAVERNELGSFRLGAHYYLVTSHHVSVKAVERLSVGHHYIVGNIYDVVDGAQTYGAQPVLQPLGTLLYVAAGQAYAGVTAARFPVFYIDCYGQVVVVHGETRAVGAVQCGLVAVALEPCVEVTRHSPVRKCVGAVGRDVYFYEPVALHVVVFSRRLSHGSVFRQHYYAVMARADAYFVLRTEHAEAVYPAEF